MSDELEKAVASYQQRQREREAALSNEERERIAKEKAERIEYERLAKLAATDAEVVSREVAAVNSEMAGRIPKIIEVSSGGNSPGSTRLMVSRSLGYALESPGGGYNSQTINFSLDPAREAKATMSAPPGHYIHSPSPIELGSSAFVTREWVREMIALFLMKREDY